MGCWIYDREDVYRSGKHFALKSKLNEIHLAPQHLYAHDKDFALQSQVNEIAPNAAKNHNNPNKYDQNKRHEPRYIILFSQEGSALL